MNPAPYLRVPPFPSHHGPRQRVRLGQWVLYSPGAAPGPKIHGKFQPAQLVDIRGEVATLQTVQRVGENYVLARRITASPGGRVRLYYSPGWNRLMEQLHRARRIRSSAALLPKKFNPPARRVHRIVKVGRGGPRLTRPRRRHHVVRTNPALTGWPWVNDFMRRIGQAGRSASWVALRRGERAKSITAEEGKRARNLLIAASDDLRTADQAAHAYASELYGEMTGRSKPDPKDMDAAEAYLASGLSHLRAAGELVGVRRAESIPNSPRRRGPSPAAVATFERWHGFGPRKVSVIDGPPEIPREVVKLGEVPEIIYRSNKWGGRSKTYVHKTEKPHPVLATDPQGKHLFLLGGNVAVTKDGLIG